MVPSRARAPGDGPDHCLARLGVRRQRATLRSRARADRPRRDRADRADRHVAGRGGRAADRSRLPALPRARPVAPRARVSTEAAVVRAVCIPRPAAQLDPRGRRGRPGRPAVGDRRRRPPGTLGRCTSARRPGHDVGRRGGRVPRTRPPRRGRRHGHDRRSVSALRRRSRCRARPADGRRAPDGARPLRPRTLGGDDGLESRAPTSTRATTGAAPSGST